MPNNSATNKPPAQVITRFWHRRPAYQKWGAVAAVALALIVLVLGYKDTEEMTGGARLIRDLAIFGAGIIGIWLTVWRLELAEKRLLNEQFANAAALMAKETTGNNPKPAIAARISGIYVMADLAKQKPKEFAERVVINLIAYIKTYAQETATPELEKDKTPDKPRKLGGDVKAAFAALSSILDNSRAKGFIGERVLDFSHQNFSHLDISISEVSLHRYRYWVETDFRGSNLPAATFKENAMLIRTNFTKANMKGVTFHSGSTLASPIMIEADLSYASMQRVNLSTADLRGANLAAANLQGCNLSGVKMYGVNMQGAQLQEAGGDTPANLSYARLHGANLAGAELQGVNMKKALLWGIDFTNAILQDVNLSDAMFWGTHMANAEVDKKTLTENVKTAMNDRIIHAETKELAGEVRECSGNFNWQLDEYEDYYALNGVLHNFVKEGENMRGGLALRKQAWKLRNDKRISPELREWLKKVNPDTGKHPDDDMPL